MRQGQGGALPLSHRALRGQRIDERQHSRMERDPDVRRAPDHPEKLSAENAAYVENILRRAEKAFGLDAFPGQSFT
jgi:hypothetical protein